MNMENNYAFIDGQNLHSGTRMEGWRIDFFRFRQYLRFKYGVGEAIWFIGYVPENKPLYRRLTKAGFKLVFKDAIKISSGKLKANVDAELVLECVDKINSYDKAILVTADGDFVCLVSYLLERGKLKMVLSPSEKNCSSLLNKRAGGRIRPLIGLREKIGLKK
uniref:Uncharacterized conserved protein, LabA/DUF88 family n=1 Tax=Candidatus Kentrum sp. TUN TaxID=2126343 RepID=A0A450ZRM2_9GAMM|nr:MAG: Uncharacterized conserved protein, LabA/DUF88 family [Candidatus Kentron sp. TUN]